MENIGNILKESRISQGYTLEDMSAKTKLSIIQLEAIENGDIPFFKDDLSYLSYFVRYYANALNIDYGELRQELDRGIVEYTDSITVSQIKKQDEINKNIKSVASTNKNVNLRKVKKAGRFDIATIGWLALAVAIIALMGYVFVTQIMTGKGATDPIAKPEITLPETAKPEPETTKPETTKPEPEKTALTVKKIDKNNYEISGWKATEDLTFDFTFANKSWMGYVYKDQALGSPADGMFDTGASAKAIMKPEKDKVFSVRYGNINGNTITLNGKAVEIDAEIAKSTVADLNFKFVEGV